MMTFAFKKPMVLGEMERQNRVGSVLGHSRELAQRSRRSTRRPLSQTGRFLEETTQAFKDESELAK